MLFFRLQRYILFFNFAAKLSILLEKNKFFEHFAVKNRILLRKMTFLASFSQKIESKIVLPIFFNHV
jgi:hypothetical protein